MLALLTVLKTFILSVSVKRYVHAHLHVSKHDFLHDLKIYISNSCQYLIPFDRYKKQKQVIQ